MSSFDMHSGVALNNSLSLFEYPSLYKWNDLLLKTTPLLIKLYHSQ